MDWSVLQRHDNPYVIRCTMTHHPPPLLTLLNSLDKLAPKEIIVEPVLSPNYRYYNLTFDQDDYQKLIKQNETLLSKLIQDFKNGKCVYNPYRRFLQAINTFKHNDASIFHCGACRYSLNVGADGSLYPCCRFSGMHDWKIGNLYDKLDIKKANAFGNFMKTYVIRVVLHVGQNQFVEDNVLGNGQIKMELFVQMIPIVSVERHILNKLLTFIGK